MTPPLIIITPIRTSRLTVPTPTLTSNPILTISASTPASGPTPTPLSWLLDLPLHNNLFSASLASLPAFAMGRVFEDDKPGVDDSGNPGEESQHDGDEELEAAACADEDGERWEEDGKDG